LSGLASGLDTAAIVKGLVAIERQPIARLEARRETTSSLRQVMRELAVRARELSAKASALKSALAPIVWSASSADPAKVRATADPGAAQGTHEVSVTQRAAATRLVSSEGVADASAAGTFGTGTILLRVGAVETAIEIGAGMDSLEGVRDAINASGESVRAAIVNDGSEAPYRLVVTGLATGAENAVSLDASGLSGGSATLFLTSLVAARDALFSVDGIEMTRPENTVRDAIEGVTLDFAGETAPGTSVLVTVAIDTEASAKKIVDLVAAYNSLAGMIRDRSRPGKDGAPGGPLLGDFGAGIAERRLRAAVAAAAGPEEAPNLAAIGIVTERDGTLRADQAKISAAIAKSPEAVAALVSDAATRLFDAANDLGISKTGLFEARGAALDAFLRDLDAQIARKEDALARLEEDLARRFAALEGLLGRFRAQSDFLLQKRGSSS
jgi:flagellar hook-associated protein 2